MISGILGPHEMRNFFYKIKNNKRVRVSFRGNAGLSPPRPRHFWGIHIQLEKKPITRYKSHMPVDQPAQQINWGCCVKNGASRPLSSSKRFDPRPPSVNCSSGLATPCWESFVPTLPRCWHKDRCSVEGLDASTGQAPEGPI